MQEIKKNKWVPSLGRKDPLEKETTTHSRILAWGIPRTEDAGGLQSVGLQGVGQDLTCMRWAVSLTNSLKKGSAV